MAQPTKPHKSWPQRTPFPTNPSSLALTIGRAESTDMEGLIPLLYKAIKDRRASRAGGYGAEHDRFVAHGVDLEDPEQRRRWLQQEVRSPLHAPASSSAASYEGRHGRNRSLEELAGEVGAGLPKARSVRVFSCIGAGAA